MDGTTNDNRRPRQGWTIGAACLVVLLGSATERAAGQMATEPAPQPREELTVEIIEARIMQVREAKDLDDAVRTRALDLYRQVLDNLKRAADLAAGDVQCQHDTSSVTDRAQQARQELESLRTRPAPMLPETENLKELEQELVLREQRLAERKKELAHLDLEPKRRANRRREIRTLLFSAPERIAELRKQLDAPSPTDEPAAVTAARRAELLTRRRLVELETTAFQNELALYDAADAVDLLRLRRDLLTQRTALEEIEVRLLSEQVTRRRRLEAEQGVRQARLEEYGTHALLRPYAERNRVLAEETQAVTRRIEVADAELKQTRDKLNSLKREFDRTKEKINSVGLTGPIGLLLRKQRAGLPDLRNRHRSVASRREKIDEVQLALFEFDEERSRLANPEPLVQEVLGGVPPDLNEAQRNDLEWAARDVLEKQREYLDSLNRGYNTYFNTLGELLLLEKEVIRETEEYAHYIDERVLWIRNGLPLLPGEFRRDSGSLAWLCSPQHWREAGRLLWIDAEDNLVLFASALLLFASLFYVRGRFLREFEEIAAQTQRSTFYRFAPTFRAALLTVLLAVFGPGLLWYVGWRLNEVANGSEFAIAAAYGVLMTVAVYFPLEMFRQICRPDGLAEGHFGWPESSVRLLRGHLCWLMLVGLPLVFVTTTLHADELDAGGRAFERLGFVLAMLALAVFVQRVLRPVGGVLQGLIAYSPESWIARLKHVWHVLGVLAPIALAALAVVGYYYTAQQFTWRLKSTIWLLLALIVARAFLWRWVLVRRRKLSIEQARERRAAAEQAQQCESSLPSNVPQPVEPQADLAQISSQAQRLLHTGLAAVALTGVWLIWADMFPALSVLDRWPLWYTAVQATHDVSGPDAPAQMETVSRLEAITVADVGLAVLIAVLTVIAARNIPGLLEMSLLQRLPLDAALRYAITTLASYAIVILGIVLTGGMIGLSWSKIQWLATALTFGLAFGLQEIFANFVAGLIILFERPVRVGDVVTVADVSGVVSRIRIRATTITNWDRKEFIVPNKEFITGRLLNWTLSDAVNRLVVNVGVAYGSDTERTHALLLQVAQEHPLVLDDPVPVATFEGFGDSTLNFSLRTYLPNMENRLAVTHDLHSAINRKFRESGIEIAFPQRDLHLRTLPPALAGIAHGTTAEVVPEPESDQQAA